MKTLYTAKALESLFWEQANQLYWLALSMKDIGTQKQYRRFGVGAAGLAFNSNTIEKVFGYNSKFPKRRIERCCAEDRTLQMVLALELQKILGLVIVGQRQPDDFSQVESMTLHPCHSCRIMLNNSSFISNDSPIVTALPPPPESSGWTPTQWYEWDPLGEANCERLTVEKLLEIHKH